MERSAETQSDRGERRGGEPPRRQGRQVFGSIFADLVSRRFVPSIQILLDKRCGIREFVLHHFFMKLALHRSVTFWSGLLVMGFILWSWGISYQWRSYVNYRGFAAIQAEGYVSLGRTGWPTARDAGAKRVPRGQYTFQLVPPPFIARGQESIVDPAPSGPRPYRDALLWAYSSSPLDAWGVFLPHWVLLLAWCAAWLGLLVLRTRKRKRTITP